VPNVNFGSNRLPSKEPDSLSDEIHRLSRGKLNVTFSFTPTEGVALTTIYHRNIGKGSYIMLSPLTPEAAAVLEKFSEDSSLRVAGTGTVIKHPIFSSVTLLTFMGLIIGS